MKKLLLINFIFFIFSSPVFAGNWIEDSISSMNVSGASSFENQKKGYFSAPSLSLRTDMSTIRPASISAPRFNVGCGGIDVFLGSFGFLQPEYLVAKFKKLLSAAAPAVAYSIAMGVVSDEIKNTYHDLTAIIDRINQLQLDSCKATKAITLASKDFSFDNIKNQVQELYASTGALDVWDQVKEFQGNRTNKEGLQKAGMSPNNMISNCSALIKEISNPNQYVIKNLMENTYSLNHNDISMVRGIFGDYYVSNDISTSKAITPRNAQADITLEKIINGDFEIATGDSGGSSNPKLVCKEVSNVDSYTSLKKMSYERLKKIGLATYNKDYSSLDNKDKNFLQTVPFGIVRMFQFETAGKTLIEAKINIENLASIYHEYIAALYAYKIVEKYIAINEQILKNLESDIKTNITEGKNCVTFVAEALVENHLKDSKNKSLNLSIKLMSQLPNFEEKLARYITAYDKFSEREKKFNKIVQKKLTKK